MTATTADLYDDLGASFAGACDDLFEARSRLARRDSPEHREVVALCLERIDGVLDLALALRSPRPSHQRIP